MKAGNHLILRGHSALRYRVFSAQGIYGDRELGRGEVEMAPD